MTVDETTKTCGDVKRDGCCCTPAPDRTQLDAQAQRASTVTDAKAGLDIETKIDMVSLPGGEFLMGTDYGGGFPQDGEGPVRAVELSPFQIDAFPVTNADFAAFVDATGYRTEAERFGWSFVFWSHIPVDRRAELIEDTVAAAPWWC